MKQAFVHPRPGLMTPYLSEEWSRLWKVALAEAERLDMNLWIYDENSYPSGFAGGLVPERMPESRGMGLLLKKGAPSADFLAVFELRDDGWTDVTAKVRAKEYLSGERLLSAVIQRAKPSPWHGGRTYVDLLRPGVTEKFLEVTLGAYDRAIGASYGKRMPGVFTDEPNLIPAGGLPWTEDLPARFQERFGYNLLEYLPALTQPLGDWKKVRHDYYRLLSELYIERWAKPYYEACEKRGIAFTGHYWEHEWPNCNGVPDNMAMAAWQQIPGIDTLMNQYAEDTHAQFGNVRAVREVASVANQLGRKRVLCEVYGAGGWDLRFEDMKRIADWLLVLGVNLLDEHLSYVTIRGARKRDHPQSFSYHEPWWRDYHVRAGYVARLSAALSQGEQVNRILVIEPTATAWMLQGTPELKALGDRFQALLMSWEQAQVEYDLGCEEVIASRGSVKGKDFVVGRRSYSTVVIPPLTETIYGKTKELLEAFAAAGGRVICLGDPPSRVDGRAAEVKLKGGKLEAVASDFSVRRAAGDKGILFHHRRRLADGEILFLVNTSIKEPSSGTAVSVLKGVERWDPATGKISPHPFRPTEKGVEMAFHLPPCGSLLVFLTKEKREPAPEPPAKVETIEPVDGVRVGDVLNALTLDYVDVEAGGKTKTKVYFYEANKFVFLKHGFKANPWDNAVQFKDEILKKEFPTDGFTVTYRFTIEGKVPEALEAVVERPDLYEISLNGTPVKPQPGRWWLDRSFGVLDIREAAKVGVNELVLRAPKFNLYHEVEPVYIRGTFGLKPAAAGFVIAPAWKLEVGSWKDQGCPFYSEGVGYTETFELPEIAGTYSVSMPDWYGSVAEVEVNGKPAGVIESAPWELDVTGHLKAGANEVKVSVVGTLKNLLGPHHARPKLGSAWPSMFQKAPREGPPPGEKYFTVGYGLFRPFTLKRRG